MFRRLCLLCLLTSKVVVLSAERMFLVQVLVAGSVESEGIYDAVQGILCVFFETRGLLVELFSLIIFVGSCLGEREPRSISLFVGFRAKVTEIDVFVDNYSIAALQYESADALEEAT